MKHTRKIKQQQNMKKNHENDECEKAEMNKNRKRKKWMKLSEINDNGLEEVWACMKLK